MITCDLDFAAWVVFNYEVKIIFPVYCVRGSVRRYEVTDPNGGG